jgi:hypothetical protein
MAPDEPGNGRRVLEDRVAERTLRWSGPAAILFARCGFALLAGGLVASLFALQGSASPWVSAAGWFPVYASLIDLGCLAALFLLTRREGIRMVDLTGFDRRRLRPDLLLTAGLLPIALLLIGGGIVAASLLVYGALSPPPDIFRPLPLPAALYAVLVFPLLWGFTEQSTYNGYLAPRIQALSGSTVLAVVLVAFAWSVQHAAMPVTFDGRWMLYRALAPVPFSVFQVVACLRLRRLLPFIIVHAVLDGADAFLSLLLPLLR